MATKVSVYIGRFQPFHLGHAHVLKNALATSNTVIVLVGSADQPRTIKNPFTFEERKEMIERWHLSNNSDSCLIVLPIRDQPYNNSKWIQSVQEAVEDVLEERQIPLDTKIVLTGSDRDHSTWYLSAFPQWGTSLVDPVMVADGLSATQLRTRLFGGHPLDENWDDVPASTRRFLRDFIGSQEFQELVAEYKFIEGYKKSWAAAPYAPTFVTVDAVVIQSGHVLVVERGALPGKGLWALPGGFVNQNERLEHAVLRELKEETGIKVPNQVLRGSIEDKEIFDNPDRSLRGRTITTAYLIRLDDTLTLPRVKGQNAPLHETDGKEVVETAKAFWLPINEARANGDKWFEDHLFILDWALGAIKD